VRGGWRRLGTACEEVEQQLAATENGGAAKQNKLMLLQGSACHHHEGVGAEFSFTPIDLAK
jgi:hypothetical protein